MDPQSVKDQNKRSYNEILKFNQQSILTFQPILVNDLPHKTAGVGTARKIGMDEAARRFITAEDGKGIISCFDADSLCDKNYLIAIVDHMSHGAKIDALNIYYEHPISGNEFGKDTYERIVQYELHLRYYVHMQKWCGLPYAHQTVGSSMAVRVDAYAAVGGMNKRKAGEDFYFMHKLVKHGMVEDLVHTRVVPSPRISDRVPFGTGRAIGEMRERESEIYFSYDPRSFIDIKKMREKLDYIYRKEKQLDDLSTATKDFLNSISFSGKVKEIKSNTKDFTSFQKRFYQWFDAFTLMKYLHYIRSTTYPDMPVSDCVFSSPLEIQGSSARVQLEEFRELDKVSKVLN